MTSYTTATPALNVGYSTYKSKRHSRTSSATIIATEQSHHELDAPGRANGSDQGHGYRSNGNGTTTPAFSFGSPSSSRGPITPPSHREGSSQAFFSPDTPSASPSTRATSPSNDAPQPKSISPLPPGSPPYNGTMPDKSLPPPPSEISTAANSTQPVVNIEIVSDTHSEASTSASRESRAAPNGKGKAEEETKEEPPLPSPSTSAGSHRSQKSQTSQLRPSGSTFRHVPLRSSKPGTPSPLRPTSSLRAFSGASPSSLHPPTTLPLARVLSPSTRSSIRPALDSRPMSQNSMAPSISSSISTSALPSPLVSPGLVGPPGGGELLRKAATSQALSPAPLAPSTLRVTSPSPLPSPTTQPSTPSLPYEIRQQSSFLERPPTSGMSTPAERSKSPMSTSATAPNMTAGPSKPTQAPYRPGFQPKGVYSPRTDEFVALRASRLDGKRADEKRLLRRLEKLVDLHFSPDHVASRAPPTRRSSSFLDFSELKGKGAATLWKGVVESASARNERQIRDAEQSITRWEDDKDVSACPICLQSFHPLTNRKHHCRLCGRVVCSLPPKPPTRPRKCSLLIIADHRTGKIEEALDVIAYGVTRKDSMSNGHASAKEKEAHLQGVRICRDCNGTVQRQQFTLQSNYIPPYARLHKTLIRLEQQIEESLPQFQELILSAAKGDSPPEHGAATTRKEILDMFSEYDSVAKRIRVLPAIPGSSQERLQVAITHRASLFLQQHMFPLKRLVSANHKPKGSSQTSSATSETGDPLTPNGLVGLGSNFFPRLDSDAALAHSLQPLLEQEALLESYVQEATHARKFEDAQTLKSNLDEIRAEISRLTRDGKIG